MVDPRPVLASCGRWPRVDAYSVEFETLDGRGEIPGIVAPIREHHYPRHVVRGQRRHGPIERCREISGRPIHGARNRSISDAQRAKGSWLTRTDGVPAEGEKTRRLCVTLRGALRDGALHPPDPFLDRPGIDALRYIEHVRNSHPGAGSVEHRLGHRQDRRDERYDPGPDHEIDLPRVELDERRATGPPQQHDRRQEQQGPGMGE